MLSSTRDWELWSTHCRLVVTDPDVLVEAVAITDDLLRRVEAACSRFRDDSELRRLRTGWNDLSPLLADLVREAMVAAWLSDGAVDPTVGSALVELGYDRTIAEVAGRDATTPDVLDPARLRLVEAVPGWRALRLEGRRLHRPEGVQLDLGATAKAVAADRCAAAVADALGTGVLVSLGGDIATAGPGPEGGWQVRVHDLPTDVPQQVGLTPGAAVATSSTVRRTWRHAGRSVHHVVDPATGLPTAGPWRTATVVAEDCARANTAATGALVKGHDATAWLRGLGLPARLVDRSGLVRTLNDFPREVAA